MATLNASKVILPFAKINIDEQPDGSKAVRAYLLLERQIEGASTGVALDGSASMRPAYGFLGFSGFLFNNRRGTNQASAEAQKMCSYLADTLAADYQTAVIYWGTGSRSRSIEFVGDLTAAQAKSFDFKGPERFGGGKTALLPAVRYYVDRFSDAKWGMFIFITDGVVGDIKKVKRFSKQLAQEIEAGSRKPLKFVILGIGDQVDHRQMIELDDLETGTALDLWDYKVVKDMNQLAEIFAEVVDDTVIVAEQGVLRDGAGNLVMDYRDTGVPALLVFKLPSGAADAFILEIGDQVIRQPLT